MEHGLYFLAGKGLYYLGDRWMEVEEGDFIWMRPDCPQGYYATGETPSRYIYLRESRFSFVMAASGPHPGH